MYIYVHVPLLIATPNVAAWLRKEMVESRRKSCWDHSRAREASGKVTESDVGFRYTYIYILENVYVYTYLHYIFFVNRNIIYIYICTSYVFLLLNNLKMDVVES